jgi:hypothetical protein
MENEITKMKLKDLKNNPHHTGKFDKEKIKVLETSIKNLGVLRSFSVFKKGKDYCLVCGHHTREAAINVLGKDKEVEITVQPYDDDTAVWGMAVENLTQDGDVKRKIEDLDNVRKYLKKTFKNYKEYAEFMKRKGFSISVGISDKNIKKKGRWGEGRPTGYEIGSSRNISDWLNRDGTIIDFHEICELLRLKDNLSPDLYEKMVVGDRKGKKENKDDEMPFTLTDAKMLSSLGNDHKEQKEVLNAMENSLGERMFRSRTRSKVLTKYKELKKASETGTIKIKAGKKKDGKTDFKEVKINEKDKKKIKESIDLIRKGKKDIGNISLPNIELPQSITEVTIREFTHELQDKFRILGNEMDIYAEEKLSQNTSQQLESWLMYLESWGNHKFANFFKAVVKEAAKKRVADGNDDKSSDKRKIFEFKFDERR